jgi:phosphosulfolactate synthase
MIEISNGTIPMSDAEKALYIARAAEEFTVVSEVGFKDQARARELSPRELIASVRSDLRAGATMVIAEARESGRSGICNPDGSPRADLLDGLIGSGVDLDRVLFEAPTKDLQTFFIKLAGPNVNLGNIAPEEVLAVETLRLGLRSDTLTYFERQRDHA